MQLWAQMDLEKALWQIFYRVKMVMKLVEVYKNTKAKLERNSIEERAQKGIFLAFQYPLEIPGVNTTNFLKTSLNTIRKAKGEKELDTLTLLKLIKEKASDLSIDEKFLSRQLNVGFSGGEKKKMKFFK